MTRRKKTTAQGTGEDSSTGAMEDTNPAAPEAPGIAPAGDNAPLVLAAIITIAEVAAFKDQLLAHINRKGAVILDGTRVASVDTAGLQILLAFVRTLQGHGAVIRWTGVSPALFNTAQLLGLEEQIGLKV